MEEDKFINEKAVELLEDAADEQEIARTKRFSFGQAETRTEIDLNDQSHNSSSTPGSMQCQEQEGDWLRIDHFDLLDMRK